MPRHRLISSKTSGGRWCMTYFPAIIFELPSDFCWTLDGSGAEIALGKSHCGACLGDIE